MKSLDYSKAVMHSVVPLLLLFVPIWGCITPSGIDDGSKNSLSSLMLLDLPKGGIFGTLIPEIGVPTLSKYETPIAIRGTHITLTMAFSTVNAFHPKALERFGRRDVSESRRRCQATTSEQTNLFELHRRVALAYALAEALVRISPEVLPTVKGYMVRFGLPFPACGSLNRCDDISTPWGLARQVAIETMDIFSRDGWNSEGSLSRKFNRIPFEDYRTNKYIPKDPVKSPQSWQPLLESNNKGFTFRQQFVVPHIGDTHRSLHFSDSDICNARVKPAHYNYTKEIKRTLRRMARLTETRKAEIVLFDNKLSSLVPVEVQLFAGLNRSLDDTDSIAGLLVTAAAPTEATVLAWKEKERTDLIRPPTIIARRFRNKKVWTYAGPGKGTRRISGNEWQPYIRTMPHPEYPSGSSCICQAFGDSLSLVLGGGNALELIGKPVRLMLKKSTNRFEPGFPTKDISLDYDSLAVITRACGTSRLHAGLHFTNAVPEGGRLCSHIGKVVFEDVMLLMRGESPKFSSIFPGRPRSNARCP